MAGTILRLPPSLRTALAIQSYGSLSRISAGLLLNKTSNPDLRVHNALFRAPWAAKRGYATVLNEDTKRLFEDAAPRSDKEGKNDPKLSPHTSNNTNVDTEAQQSVPAEQDAILHTLRKRARRRSSGNRLNLRRAIANALNCADPLPALRRLVLGGPKVEREEGTKATAPTPTEEEDSMGKGSGIRLLDVKHVQATHALPRRDQYPRAPERLFIPTEVATTILNACAQSKVSIETQVDYTLDRRLSKADLQKLQNGILGIQVCNLNVEIAGVFQGTSVGEGTSKANAKKAAWLCMLSKLHEEGALKELFPDPNQVSQHVLDTNQGEDDLPETTDVDRQTLEEEKDAKVEIYNYAATMGFVPQFETRVVQPRTPRPRLGRTPKKPKSVVEVKIQLGELGINVSAVGKDLVTAEIAAAVAFKQEAEKQHKTQRTESAYATLNADTAKQFFEFYKNRERGLNLEVEHEAVSQGSFTQHSARLAINGVPFGQAAVMQSKRKADSIAYLTAAIDLITANPSLLAEFEQKFKEGRGKVLQPISSIDLQVQSEALQTMRTALLEARNAGLPDSRSTLTAEVADPGRERRSRKRPLMGPEYSTHSERLLAEQRKFRSDPKLHELRSKRAALPMNHYEAQVFEMISNNLYSIVVGATGSGKTTQVPQILFDKAIESGNGAFRNIICTQPRRIAATSVAQRVAVERNEPLRKTVGYQVRFDAQLPCDPYGITYCTTGILLEKLKHEPDEVFDTTSHLLIDEVHERDLNIDFLMIILKQAMKRRHAEGKLVPKVVLMSATLDTELFARYFGQPDEDGMIQPCPSLSVPGRTFPVKEKFLGSIMHDLLQAHGPSAKALVNQDPKSSEYLKVETAFSGSHKKADGDSAVESVIDWKRERQPALDSDQDASVANEKEEALVPVSLLVATIGHICSTTQDGAILAFLPGLEEIMSTQRALLESPIFGQDFNNASKFQICLLHSSVPKEDQAKIFQRSPPGCRKIILSTNIAETSVTVTEVKFVVDTGKLRETRYDQMRRITRLQCVWESKSNSKQRAGRAGRVQDGFYYALFSKERQDSLRAIGLPELLRSDLQVTCLSIKAQKFQEPVASFLAQAIEPPSRQAIHAAVQNLIAIEAYTPQEELTALGRLLSRLPVHPALGKMIVLGVIFKCLDPMIILGAAAEERSLFVVPPLMRAEANRAHRSYAGNYQSDQMAFLEAYKELRLLKDQYGLSAMNQRAREKFLHAGAFRTIDQTAKQIEGILIDSGLIDDQSLDIDYGPAEMNRNANDTELIKCLLLAGFHPNLAVKRTDKGMVYRTAREQTILMHPSSVNAEKDKGQKHSYGTLFAFGTLARSNDGNTLFSRGSTHVTPLMAALFGGQLRMNANARLEMDDWLPFFVKTYDRQFATKLILEFRKALDRVLNSAFSSLSDLNAGDATSFADDPIRDKFASRVVEVLGHASGRQLQSPWTSARK